MRLKLFPFLFFLRWPNTFKKAHLLGEEKLTLPPHQWRKLKVLSDCIITKKIWAAPRTTFLPSNIRCSSCSIEVPFLPSLLFYSSSFPSLLHPFFCFSSLLLFPSPLLTLYITNTKTASNSNPASTAKMITHTGTGMGAGWTPQVTLVVTCCGGKGCEF